MACYLVTGAAGFIGWRVCEQLLDAGHAVVGLDNLNHAYDVRLKQWRLARLRERPGFTFHPLDITDHAALTRLFLSPLNSDPPFDAVINLAARAGVRPSVENPWVYFETNVTGTLNLLELCRTHGVRRFILASTSSLYGARNPLPFREDADTDGPLSPYAASKKAAEVLCHTYHHLYGFDIAILRYFTVYGPAGRPDMSLFRFVQWVSEDRPVVIYGDGTQARDFTYVDDIARGTLAALAFLESDPSSPKFEIINLGSDRPVVLRDALGIVESLVGEKARVEYRPRHRADVPATWADITKARRLLGWSPQTPLEEGLARLVAWYRENRAWARHVATTE
ncbi:UDP-glucose 4-epimerase [bacterium HR11]|nr:UDP-glucose 4-epimerase [bacterium HR11]